MILIRIIAGLGLGGAAGALLGYFGSCTSGACPLTATPWRGALFGALLGLVAVFAAGSGCGAASRAKPDKKATAGTMVPSGRSADAGTAAPAPRKISDAADFKATVEDARGIVFVDFYADWCGWCHKLAPVVDKLAGDYAGKVTFVKVDTDAEQELAQRFGVQGLPTMVIFKDGRPAQTIVGYRDEAGLKEIIDKALAG
jgi:thioredoxin 1